MDMLKQISIQNYALIEESTIVFPSGLTVITGETGAGKSILLGALGLILGQRADVTALSNKTKKCVIEGVFNIRQYKLSDFFKEQELDYEDDTTIRREISPEGKSRAFVNDTPVNLNVLKLLAEQLIDVHSQHETLLLNDKAFQFQVLDSFAGLKETLSNYKLSFKELKTKERKLQELLDRELQAKKEADYINFQFNEIEQANIIEGEFKKLEEESDTLNNAETIKINLIKAVAIASEGEGSIVSQLNTVKTLLNPISKYGKRMEELFARVQSSLIELKDIGNEITDIDESIVFDLNRLEIVNAKLDTYNRLFKKHAANSEEELLKIKSELEEKLLNMSSLEEEIKKLNKEVNVEAKILVENAQRISKKRLAAIPQIEKNIKRMLGDLSMPNAQFKISCTQSDKCSVNGIDELVFLFSANKGSEFNELHKVASGGELSRLMLCVKDQIARLTALPTIIFDEIDTGVSGDVAHKIGNILEKMAEGMQVIAITHLPQIAVKGKHHLFVFKRDIKEKTVSDIKVLKKEERVLEIAKMLSTGKPTEAALGNAKELLNYS
jgi:DNA repair protein RecN (Recombination protein N)